MGLGNSVNLPWWRSKYILWLFLMTPGLLFIVGFIREKMTYDSLMHSTGEFSARFLVFTLAATPLLMLLPRFKFPKWLNRNKRYFGVASFGYGLIHLLAYSIEIPGEKIMEEFFDFGLLTGWIAFIIWIPMAMTSTNRLVKSLKTKWKKIHNWGYLAAVLVFLHWAFIHFNWKPALVHAAPILILQGYRWIKILRSKSNSSLAQ